MTDQLPSKGTTKDLSNGYDEALQEIQPLREDLARAESAHAAVMAENAYYKQVIVHLEDRIATLEQERDDAVLGLVQLKHFANQQWVQRRMLSNAQMRAALYPMGTCQPPGDDWCPTCTKPYDQCRCNGVQL